MNKNLIEVGGEYRVGDSSSFGRAVVKGPAIKNSYSNIYSFPVEFPDHVENGNPTTKRIPSREFVSLWREEDEERWQRVMEKRIRLDAIENGLVVAGFNPSFVRDLGPSRGLYIGFEGEIAQEVVNILVKDKDGSE